MLLEFDRYWYSFSLGFQLFPLSFVAWIIHLYERETTINFWYTLDNNDCHFIGVRYYDMAVHGWDFLLDREIDTLPKE